MRRRGSRRLCTASFGSTALSAALRCREVVEVAVRDSARRALKEAAQAPGVAWARQSRRTATRSVYGLLAALGSAVLFDPVMAALVALARIVHAADFRETRIGFPLVARDDRDTLGRLPL